MDLYVLHRPTAQQHYGQEVPDVPTKEILTIRKTGGRGGGAQLRS